MEGKGLFTNDVSHKWGDPDPPLPIVAETYLALIVALLQGHFENITNLRKFLREKKRSIVAIRTFSAQLFALLFGLLIYVKERFP